MGEEKNNRGRGKKKRSNKEINKKKREGVKRGTGKRKRDGE